MPITPNMLMDLPTEGDTADEWDTKLNVALTSRNDVHDHTTGFGVRVPTAGIKINADLTFLESAVYYAAKDVKAIDFQPSAAGGMTGYSSALFVSSSDNNLYFRNSAGNNVQITAAGTLNIAIAGAIGGDYASVSALLAYNDAAERYTFETKVAREWADVAHADLDLYQHGLSAAITNRVKLRSPAALAASYDITFWSALPGAQNLVQLSATGQLLASNTITSTITLSANQNIIQSGTGEHKHGDKILPCPVLTGFATAGAPVVDANFGIAAAGAANIWLWSLPGLIVGDRIRSVQFRLTRAGGTSTFTLRRVQASGVAATIGTVTAAAGALQTVTLAAIDYTVIAGEQLLLHWSSGAAADILHASDCTFDHP
jgi:hypothetical protein